MQEFFIIFFFIFRHREFKVEREYKAKVFNGFIDAWFIVDFWQVNISYEYADIWEWLKRIFLVFFITIFPEKHKIK